MPSSHREVEGDLYKIASSIVAAKQAFEYKSYRIVPRTIVDRGLTYYRCFIYPPGTEGLPGVFPVGSGFSYRNLNLAVDNAKEQVDKRLLAASTPAPTCTPSEFTKIPPGIEPLKKLHRKESYGHGILYLLAKEGPKRTSEIYAIFPIKGSSTLTYMRRQGLIEHQTPNTTSPWLITPLGKELLALRGNFDLAGMKARNLYGKDRMELGKIELRNQSLEQAPDDPEADEIELD
jgi:hypothetical protein